MQLYQKAFSRDAWPSVAFTADEARALHAVTNAVNIYDPASFSTGAPLLAPCFRVHMATRTPWRLLAYTSRHALCRLQPACTLPWFMRTNMEAQCRQAAFACSCRVQTPTLEVNSGFMLPQESWGSWRSRAWRGLRCRQTWTPPCWPRTCPS